MATETIQHKVRSIKSIPELTPGITEAYSWPRDTFGGWIPEDAPLCSKLEKAGQSMISCIGVNPGIDLCLPKMATSRPYHTNLFLGILPSPQCRPHRGHACPQDTRVLRSRVSSDSEAAGTQPPRGSRALTLLYDPCAFQ